MSLSYEQQLQHDADVWTSAAQRIAIERLITTGMSVPSGQVVYARK